MAFADACDIKRVGNVYIFACPTGLRSFPEEQLITYDVRLPEVLDYLAIHHRFGLAHIMRQTLAHWKSPAPLQEETDNKYITNVDFIESSTSIGNYLMRGDRYFTKVVHDDLVIAIPMNTGLWIPVSTEWLDAHYPGVRVKIDLLEAMGLLKDEISKMAIFDMHNRTTSADLKHVNFDSVCM